MSRETLIASVLFSAGFLPALIAGRASGSPTGCPYSFFTALGQDFVTISPHSVGASVGVHVIRLAG